MQAAVHLPDTPVLKIDKNSEIPKPGPDQVLLKVQASGICHSDVFFLSQYPEDPRTYIMGHECSGIAVALGSNVKNIKKDHRYTVSSLSGGCAQSLTRRSAPKHTPAQDPTQGYFSTPSFGIGANGGHAEYAVADASALVPVPDNVLPEHAAIAGDSGVTAWHAVKTTASVKKGDKVMITGIGGLGLLAVQFAVHLGAEVYAVDMRSSSRELALKFGAKKAFDLIDLDTELQNGFTVDTAIDFVATDTTFQKDLKAVSTEIFNTGLTRAGRVVIVGVSDQNIVINDLAGIYSGVHILFSLYGTLQEIAEVLDLFSKGHIKPVVTKRPLREANKAYDELRANLVLSRNILIPPAFWKEDESRD